MFSLFPRNRCGPIGIDLGARGLKLVQFTADGRKLIDAARVEFGAASDDQHSIEEVAAALEKARHGRAFVGRDVVLALSDRQLTVQNIRVPKNAAGEIDRLVKQEISSRLPFKIEEAEIRYFEAGDVRSGELPSREFIVLAVHRPVLAKFLAEFEALGLNPKAVDIEPAAILRSGWSQYRREEDRNVRTLYLHVGYRRSTVVIAENDSPLFVKFLEIGGKHFDEAVSRHLRMEAPAAVTLRRQNGDRRADRQDPEVERGVIDSLKPVVEKLACEIALCTRYHGVTFRGHPLVRGVISGGEANQAICDALTKRLDLKCELSDPFRGFDAAPSSNRRAQWEIACGLALREVQA